MDTRDILAQLLSSEDSISSTGTLGADGQPVKKDLSTHIEDNLSRLFECLKLEYGRRILVSPKWKNFGSQKLQLSEKTRLNNAIWRCWHIQYQKNKKPLFCQFVSPLSSEEREPPKKPLAIILQGRYWRRKLDAIAREYQKWRTYYKQKSQEAEEEAQQERLRTLSTSSGDDEVSHGSPMTQVVNLMDMQLTTDNMVHSHPDTLFTTKTAVRSQAKETIPEASISEITFQPSLDSLQPNLDEFSKHIESLVDFLTENQPNESYQVPFSTSSRESLQFGSNQLTPLNTSLTSQAPSMMSFQGPQNNVEMMDQSQNFELYSIPTGVGQENQPIQQVTSLQQDQDFMDTSENFQQYTMDYDSQMNLQSFSPSSGQPLSHEGIPLEHLHEEVEQDFFVNQNQAESTVVQGTTLTSPTQKSPIPVLPQSPAQHIPGSHLQDPKLMTSGQTRHLPYRHSSGNLQEYGTSPVRKGRLPRNVSDNQLSMIDSSQLSTLGLPFLHSQEQKIPAQVQFPNLVAHLQSSNASHSESLSTGTQAKRPRIPRNMSDSGLYDMLRTSKSHLPTSYNSSLSQFSSAMATSPPPHSSQQTPLEQIRAQAQAGQAQSQICPAPFQQTPASQIKHSTGRSRKGKLPRNMSDSSLMYMSNQNSSFNLKGFPTHRRKSNDSLQAMSPPLSLPSAHSVLSSSNQAVDPLTRLQSTHPVYASTTLASSQPFDVTKQVPVPPISSSVTGASAHEQMLLFNELQNQNQSSMASSTTPNTGLTKNVYSFAETPKTGSLLSQLLLQSEGSPELQKMETKESQNQMVKQLLQVVQNQSQFTSHKPISSQELMLAAMKSTSTNQQSTELMSLLQGTSPQQRGTDLVGTTSSSQLYHILPQHDQQQQQQQQKSLQLLQQQQQQQQQPLVQITQQRKAKAPQQATQVLEQKLQQQLLQQQQQLQWQATENQKTSQLISALKSTTQVLQQQLAQPQQLQHLQQHAVHPQLPQGAIFDSKQTMSARQPNVTIQPTSEGAATITHKVYQGPVLIAPHPKVSSNSIQGAQASLKSTLVQPVQGVTAEVQPSTTSLLSLQQMLDDSTSTQVASPSGLKVESSTLGFKTSGLPQQSTPTITSSFSFPQALFTTGTTTTAAPTTNELTAITGDLLNTVSTSASPQTPKFTRPISAADRENYKEHRRQSHITAEQKRRFNIKVGFDQLSNLVPSLAHQKNAKISKATILQKSVEYTMKLQQEKERMMEEEELLKKEIQSLHSSISACQQQLPASGVPLNRQRSDQMLTLYNEYVKARTQENFKFWILGVIFRKMFEVYNQNVSTSTWKEFCANILSWLDEHCTLPNLRPAVLSALRDISRSTSILTNPSKFPDEIKHYISTNTNPTIISDTPSSSPTKRNIQGRNYFHDDTMQ